MINCCEQNCLHKMVEHAFEQKPKFFCRIDVNKKEFLDLLHSNELSFQVSHISQHIASFHDFYVSVSVCACDFRWLKFLKQLKHSTKCTTKGLSGEQAHKKYIQLKLFGILLLTDRMYMTQWSVYTIMLTVKLVSVVKF